jgi:hypothetical protein
MGFSASQNARDATLKIQVEMISQNRLC